MVVENGIMTGDFRSPLIAGVHFTNHVCKYIRHTSTPNFSNPIKCPEKSQMLRNSANVTDAVLWWGWLTVMHAHHHFGLELNFYIKRIFPLEFEYDINEIYLFFCLFFFFQNQPKKIHNNNNWHSFYWVIESIRLSLMSESVTCPYLYLVSGLAKNLLRVRYY